MIFKIGPSCQLGVLFFFFSFFCFCFSLKGGMVGTTSTKTPLLFLKFLKICCGGEHASLKLMTKLSLAFLSLRLLVTSEYVSIFHSCFGITFSSLLYPLIQYFIFISQSPESFKSECANCPSIEQNPLYFGTSVLFSYLVLQLYFICSSFVDIRIAHIGHKLLSVF